MPTTCVPPHLPLQSVNLGFSTQRAGVTSTDLLTSGHNGRRRGTVTPISYPRC